MKKLFTAAFCILAASTMFFSCSKQPEEQGFVVTISADKEEVAVDETVTFFVHTGDGEDVTSASVFCMVGESGACFAGNQMSWDTPGVYEVVGHYYSGEEGAPAEGYETSNTVKITVK